MAPGSKGCGSYSRLPSAGEKRGWEGVRSGDEVNNKSTAASGEAAVAYQGVAASVTATAGVQAESRQEIPPERAVAGRGGGRA